MIFDAPDQVLTPGFDIPDHLEAPVMFVHIDSAGIEREDRVWVDIGFFGGEGRTISSYEFQDTFQQVGIVLNKRNFRRSFGNQKVALAFAEDDKEFRDRPFSIVEVERNPDDVQRGEWSAQNDLSRCG